MQPVSPRPQPTQPSIPSAKIMGTQLRSRISTGTRICSRLWERGEGVGSRKNDEQEGSNTSIRDRRVRVRLMNGGDSEEVLCSVTNLVIRATCTVFEPASSGWWAAIRCALKEGMTSRYRARMRNHRLTLPSHGRPTDGRNWRC